MHYLIIITIINLIIYQIFAIIKLIISFVRPKNSIKCQDSSYWSTIKDWNSSC